MNYIHSIKIVKHHTFSDGRTVRLLYLTSGDTLVGCQVKLDDACVITTSEQANAKSQYNFFIRNYPFYGEYYSPLVDTLLYYCDVAKQVYISGVNDFKIRWINKGQLIHLPTIITDEKLLMRIKEMSISQDVSVRVLAWTMASEYIKSKGDKNNET